MRRARAAIFLAVLGVHGLAVLYIATRREAATHRGDDGFSTNVFFFENTVRRDPAQILQARPRAPIKPRSPEPAAAASAGPQPRAPAAIDWVQEAELAAAASIDAAARAHRAHVGVAERYAPLRQFAWDYARTHRFVALPQGGTLINITDRCALVFSFPILLGSCRLGKKEGRADLFTHMLDPVATGDSSNP